MYGLGDSAPAPDTVALMEDILVEYLHETVRPSTLIGYFWCSNFSLDRS